MVDLLGKICHSFTECLVSTSEWAAAKGACGCARRCGTVQIGKKVTKHEAGLEWIDTGLVAGHAREPRDHRPRPGVARTRSSGPDRSRNWERQERRQTGKPPVFVPRQLDGYLPSRQADEQFVAKPPECVVEAGAGSLNGQLGEVGMLCA